MTSKTRMSASRPALDDHLRGAVPGPHRQRLAAGSAKNRSARRRSSTARSAPSTSATTRSPLGKDRPRRGRRTETPNGVDSPDVAAHTAAGDRREARSRSSGGSADSLSANDLAPTRSPARAAGPLYRVPRSASSVSSLTRHRSGRRSTTRLRSAPTAEIAVRLGRSERAAERLRPRPLSWHRSSRHRAARRSPASGNANVTATCPVGATAISGGSAGNYAIHVTGPTGAATAGTSMPASELGRHASPRFAYCLAG